MYWMIYVNYILMNFPKQKEIKFDYSRNLFSDFYDWNNSIEFLSKNLSMEFLCIVIFYYCNKNQYLFILNICLKNDLSIVPYYFLND